MLGPSMPSPLHARSPRKRPGPRGLLAVPVALALFAAPGQSRGGNTEHPRTPVLWPEAPCIQTVDRSVDANFAFAYEIPKEDTALSVDEFADSRRHQFVGFCRQHPAGQPPPIYVSVADLQRSVDEGFEDPALLDEPEATLETSAAWAGCWTRITADDARRPITFEAAAEPVVWDTTEVPAGTWMIAGYTWEPPFNIWRRTPWVVRIVDDPNAPAQAAVTLGETPEVLWSDESLEVPACVDAAPGSTLTFQWRTKDDSEWTDAQTTQLDGPAELSLPFTAPVETWGLTLLIRAVVEQPDAIPGYTAEGLTPVIVIEQSEGDTGESGDTGPETGDAGDTGVETGAETGTGGDAGTEAGGDELGDEAGVGDGAASTGRCSLTSPRGKLSPFVLAVLCLLGWSRRRLPRAP